MVGSSKTNDAWGGYNPHKEDESLVQESLIHGDTNLFSS